MHILVVHPEQAIRQTLVEELQRQWYGTQVVSAATAELGLELFRSQRPDMVLLATNSAERRAFDVLQEIRRVSETPVMLFGPSSSEREQIEGLRLGADDYVVESVSPAVLAARIEAVQRRTGFGRPGDRPPDFHSGALAIWYRRRLVTVRGVPAKLTPLEYQLLHQLAIRAGQVVPSSVLLESVWGDEYGATTKYLKVFVNRLRSKLGHGHDLPVIETERRVGYRLVRATPSVGEDVV